jgi:hypothetical protein
MSAFPLLNSSGLIEALIVRVRRGGPKRISAAEQQRPH